MKIGVISDTHIPVFSQKLPDKVFDLFKDCDIIVHAGDILEMSVIEKLSVMAEVRAVCGNMDGYEVSKKLPKKIIFETEGKKIGVVHGKGSAARIMETVKGMFKEKLDIIIFGHSHKPCSETINCTFFFNPGSTANGIFSGVGTFGIIEITNGEIKAEIIEI